MSTEMRISCQQNGRWAATNHRSGRGLVQPMKELSSVAGQCAGRGCALIRQLALWCTVVLHNTKEENTSQISSHLCCRKSSQLSMHRYCLLDRRHLDGCELAYQVIQEVAQRISRQSPQAAIKITIRPQLYITDTLHITVQVLRNISYPTSNWWIDEWIDWLNKV